MTFVKTDGKARYTADGTTDYTFRQDMRFEGPATARPTTCKMQRPYRRPWNSSSHHS